MRMKWFSPFVEGTKILYIEENGRWIPYTQSKYAVPDYEVSFGSKGYATMQKCLKLGFEFVKSEE